jgi:hypothetical protein
MGHSILHRKLVQFGLYALAYWRVRAHGLFAGGDMRILVRS